MEHERTVTTDDGVVLWTVRTGTGPPLLFAHGGPGLWDYTDPVAEMVDDLVTVVRWDQRGAGRSDRRGPYTLDRFVADVDVVRDAHGFDRVVVGGHSWGAGLALRYAVACPDHVLGLVMLASNELHWSRHRHRHGPEVHRRLGEHRDRVAELRAVDAPTEEERRELLRLLWSVEFADRVQALELVDRWLTPTRDVNWEANHQLDAEMVATEDELAEACLGLEVPTLVVTGAGDPRPDAGPHELVAALPDVRHVVLDDVGHIPWAEHPDLLRAALRDFLGEVTDRP